MGAGTLTASFLIVSVEPFLVAFIHIVDETVREGKRSRLLDGIGRLDIGMGIPPAARYIQLFIVLVYTGTVGSGDICGGRTVFLFVVARPSCARSLMPRRSGGKDSLQMVFLDR